MFLWRFFAQALSIGVLAFTGVVLAQTYPNKPIRIVTSGAGGSSDFDSRLIAQSISGSLGQQIVVDNRGGTIAADVVSKAPPDGYTLLVGGGATWIRPLVEKMSWDPVRDFSPISQIVRTVMVVAVHPSVPVNSVKQLIALAKTRPGELNYSSASVAGPGHLGAELFKSMASVNIVHVPYKGNIPAITALISGEVHLMFTDSGLLMPHVKAGKLRALAVSSAEPSALVPGLPTVAATVPGYESVGVAGFWAPAKTPATIISRLYQEIVRMVSRQDVKQKFSEMGEEVVGSSPEEFAAMMKADMIRMGKVIKDARIKVY